MTERKKEEQNHIMLLHIQRNYCASTLKSKRHLISQNHTTKFIIGRIQIRHIDLSPQKLNVQYHTE